MPDNNTFADMPAFKLWDRHDLLPQLRFVDVEASSLQDGSYPLSFGWCGLDLKTSHVIVKPEPDWTADMLDPQSFAIHGISHEHAMAEGVDARQVADMLNADLAGKAVISDSIQWDGYWTTRLADTTGVAIRFGYNDLAKVAGQFRGISDPWCVANARQIVAAIDRVYPHSHRADEDAQRMAALTRMVLDREWVNWLLDTDHQMREPA
ncbi:hypothetical protein [Agrobacterium tumefaciens]|uniref:hypothetical protein n=1 Tax=Agrobacterium tumefaciens TaxID=358 RepID=UPI0015719C84|nr:hypothetical protein [Agrobacterium tumefaciens]